jgi:hypothetical protein
MKTTTTMISLFAILGCLTLAASPHISRRFGERVADLSF